MQLNKKEETLNKMTEEEVKGKLKDKGLPTFGTKVERLERLKKFHGIAPPGAIQDVKEPVMQKEDSRIEANLKQPKNLAKDNVVNEIEKINQRREERRANLQKKKDDKQKKNEENKALGINCDVDFEVMIDKERFTEHLLANHCEANKMRLSVHIRKRPLFSKEKKGGIFF